MKRTYKFVRSMGTVTCALPTGEEIELPVVQGILKHPRVESLREMLKNPDVARKYTREALEVAPWSVLREFPRPWLNSMMEEADIRPGRAKALLFMLNTVLKKKTPYCR